MSFSADREILTRRLGNKKIKGNEMEVLYVSLADGRAGVLPCILKSIASFSPHTADAAVAAAVECTVHGRLPPPTPMGNCRLKIRVFSRLRNSLLLLNK